MVCEKTGGRPLTYVSLRLLRTALILYFELLGEAPPTAGYGLKGRDNSILVTLDANCQQAGTPAPLIPVSHLFDALQ
jgi:hypothetical protein